MTFGKKYSQDSRIEFACFSFRVALLFFINFSSLKPKITQILTLHQANVPTLTSCSILKNITFGTHRLRTFKRNTLINELLLMQFYLFNICSKLHRLK